MPRKKGIPNFKPTDEQRRQVRTYAAVGLTHEQMALLVLNADQPISVDTLTAHFGPELTSGKAQAVAQLGGRLFQIGMGQIKESSVADQSRAIMFYLKTQAGWRETAELEVTLPDGDEGGDETALAARAAGLIERGLRRKKAGETLQ